MIAHRVLPQDLNPKYTISFPSPPPKKKNKKKKKKKEHPIVFYYCFGTSLFSQTLVTASHNIYIYTHTHTHIWMQDRNFTLT